jgi:arsenite methyltransferase
MSTTLRTGCCGGAAAGEKVAAEPEQVVEQVRDRYGKIAEGELSGCAPAAQGCCGTVEQAVAVGIGYGADELAGLPEGANLGLGCGAPVHHLNPSEGETVVDLGSGAGIDALLAARRVGPGGRVIGVDMTPQMLDKARANAAKAGLGQVEFREGRLEALPVEDASVDAVTSNCVINLVPDKAAVFAEIARVLKPGGRMVISDILLDGELPGAVSKDLLAYVGCVAGAVRRETYFGMLTAAGLGPPEILEDVDYLEAASYAIPDDLRASLHAAGVRLDALRGVVRSVTFRAVKPAA